MVPMTVWAHVRQCGASLSFDKHDDPSQKVRVLSEDQLRNAVPILVRFLHLIVTFSQFHA